MSLIQELIAQKRDGQRLEAHDISQIVSAITDGSASDAQLGAFAMAVVLQGMDVDETVALTTAMRDSGDVLHWDVSGPVLDKHSSGGVGDNVSLMLAPALAACGAYVPMVSGRGLGHTGGTLDKLDAIPGYQTQPDEDLFRRVTAGIGCAIIGQTAEIAPADKRLYSIRDVTGTVESQPLICASILSKKLAAGLDSLVLDIKFGTGAFMPTNSEASELADLLVKVANGAGCATRALLTDMNEPLASAAGNALETANAIAFLRGDDIDSRLWDVTVALGAEALHAAKLAPTRDAAESAIVHAFTSGRAAEIFGRMVAALGGPANILETASSDLPTAPIIADVFPANAGFVTGINAKALGMAVIGLGGGRRVSTDAIDYAVGLDHLAGIGALTDHETPIARVHAQSSDAANTAITAVQSAYQIADTPIDPGPLIARRIA